MFLFTGIKDKNGEWIKPGDIIRFKIFPDVTDTRIVYWNHIRCGFKPFVDYGSFMSEIEIIGHKDSPKSKKLIDKYMLSEEY